MSNSFMRLFLIAPAAIGLAAIAPGSNWAIAANSAPEEAAVVTTAEAPDYAAAPLEIPPSGLDAIEPVLGESPVLRAEAIAPEPASGLAEEPAAVPTMHELAGDSLTAPWSSESMAQVTSVSQLSDVLPTDWAYQALQSLVERYGCIAGYPDGTYRGRNFLTRYEFAAGLNACMDRISELVDQATADAVSRDDLATLQRLADEFAAELATLRGRVDALEARIGELEENQFSTTTKLRGEVIFSLDDFFSDDDANNTVFRSRVRLDFVTSFTGEDALHTRISGGTVVPFESPGSVAGVAEGTKEGLFTTRIGGTTDSDLLVDWIGYYFPIGDRVDMYIAGTGGIHSDYVFSTVNPYFEDYDGGNGAISTFAQESPIYRIGGGAGVGLNLALDDNDVFVLSLGYLADEANDPTGSSGFFNGDYAALGQLTITPSDRFQVGLTYVHGYHTSDNFIFDLGAGDDFFVGTVPASAGHVGLDVPAVTNSYGVATSFALTPGLVLNAFAGYTDLIYLETGDGEIWYYGAGLAMPDLFAEGNLGGIFVGVEPYLGGEDVELGGFAFENDTSLHVEAFYRIQLNDNISITPGLVWVTAPEQNSANSDFVVGTIRTTFRF